MKIRSLSSTTVFGVAAPASAAKDIFLVEKGIAFLTDRGLSVVRGSDSYESVGYLAGTDAARTDDLNSLLRRDDIDVITCIRGGYGSLRILGQIDFDAAARSPKLILGYSDITAIQLALLARTGLPSISGPMVAIEWADKAYPFDQSVWDLLSGHRPTPVLGPKGEPLKPKKAGTAKGMLIGGNLSVLCKLIGTSYMPNLDGCILFLEEVAELPYQVDGLMAQLELSGILGRIGGLVIGDLSPPDPIPNSPSLSYRDVIDRYASVVNGPVATDLRYGHIKSKISMPIGVQAELIVDDSATLNILESVVETSDEALS